ncbi:ubiquinone/menaquinone biosynthesis C-methylase UbiE [Rhodococcus sp. PvR099]|nr:ubiquinone/menaquinone biosynthesis C-methylase UbiE [Rhodococcus sp. PvR099]PTR43456.1 methyltransferase family protein [Rhodococcus sp. OK611]SNX90801.1 Methyltransferase domain-containing protein [Rhodococcus sp. OK270]
MPFDDGTFDAVCCYAALYLVPEPMTVVDEMIRVLSPGGRIAVMTGYGREHPKP